MFKVLKGIFTNGIHCGIKKVKKDLAFIYVPNVFSSAGVFTQNKLVAACVTHTRKCLKSNNLKAVIINSGNANAATGKQGEQDVKDTAQLVAKQLGIRKSEVGVASTGVIGKCLDMKALNSGIETLLDEKGVHAQDGDAAAQAILTTDLTKKTCSLTRKIGKKNITVSGMTKGSGMIAPNMATTLLFLTTNAAIEKPKLQAFLESAINDSYNMLSVDTDTSTNDMALIFATDEYKFDGSNKEQSQEFQALLNDVCIDLAKQIALDGEGATKLIEVQVSKASSVKDAKTVAMNVVDSPLVKTAIFGEDPNWGRIVAAACKDPQVKINPNKLLVAINGLPVYENGNPLALDAAKKKKMFSKKEIIITLELNVGQSVATGWGCDLSHGYIDINTTYT